MKVTVVGRGTVGCSSVAYYLKYTSWEIDWIYDPNINPTPVGEGTTLTFPNDVRDTLNFSYDDLRKLNGTVKTGIYKEGWGVSGKPFYHNFPIGNTGIHFTAAEFQSYYFETLSKNKRVTAKEGHYIGEHSVDSDFILDCSGSPDSLNADYVIPKHITVNSAFVTQCYWDYPRFDYTLTLARPYGWVFGIPLRNRCAIGYLYNKNINTLEEVQQDVQNVFDEYGLVPSVQTRNINFDNYYRKQNFSDRVAYNGNKSFFLEPLEATSTGVSSTISKISVMNWTKTVPLYECNRAYTNVMDEIESMMCLHYMAGSKYKTDFWDHAKEVSLDKITKEIKKDSRFADVLKISIDRNIVDYSQPSVFADAGSWNINAFTMNVNGLGIRDELLKIYDGV